MKRILCLLLALVMLLSLCACGRNASEVDDDEDRKNEKDTEELFEESNKEEKITLYLRASAESDKVHIRYEYDEQGNIVRQIRYHDGEIEDEYHWEYDVMGNMTRRISYNKSGYVSSDYRFDPNAQGNSIRGVWQDELRIHELCWEYDDKGNMTRSISFTNSVVTSEYHYEYDAQGNVTREVHYDHKNGLSNHDYRYQNSYDEKGNLIQTITRYDTDSTKTTYEYDEKGNIAKEIIISIEYGTKSIVEYSYVAVTVSTNQAEKLKKAYDYLR